MVDTLTLKNEEKILKKIGNSFFSLSNINSPIVNIILGKYLFHTYSIGIAFIDDN